jgi:Tetratricopeptide repeat
MLRRKNLFPTLKSFLKICIILFVLFLLSSVALAEKAEKEYEIAIAKAVDMIENENYEGAIKDLREVLSARPEDELATLYLGIALSRSGDREAESILKKALLMNPNDPRTNLELGIYYFNKSIYDEAGDYLKNTISLAPNTDLSAKADEYLRISKKRASEQRAELTKPWSLNSSLGGQYDSNVVLDTGGNPLPQGISRKSDWRAVFYLKGKYNFIEQEKFESSISYSFYQSLHTTLNDFNVTSNLLDLRAAYHISPVITLKGMYSFEYVLVGGDSYDYAQDLSPSFVISEGRGFFTVIEYKYRNIHYQDSDLFEDNSDRTGFNNLIGITQEIPVSPIATFRIGYSHDQDNTQKDYWDYRGDKGFGEIKLNIPSNIYINLYGEYYHRDYKGKIPVIEEDRKDDVYTASISVSKALTKIFSITLGELYVRNSSNIDIFDYKRSITSLFLNARF